MAALLSTVVVAPRERFGSAVESLESLLAGTAGPFALVYVDAGSPADIHARLADLSRRHDFTLIRTDAYLTPNQARNVALPFIRTRYAAFVDNDVLFAPGWLAALERCAEEEGADIVTPLICLGKPVHFMVHHAGGLATIIERDGRRLFREQHNLNGKPVAEVRDKLVRGPTEMFEFHCVLIRKDVFDRFGPMDEHLMGTHEHLDLSMKVRDAGGRIFFEPDAVVTYLPKALSARELPFFMLRWSEAWSTYTLDHFFKTWKAEDINETSHALSFVWEHRGYGLPTLRKHALRLGGWRLGNLAIAAVEKGLAAVAGRRFAPIGRPAPFRIVHAPTASSSAAA
jgi:GT2 family glycosyltransferase